MFDLVKNKPRAEDKTSQLEIEICLFSFMFAKTTQWFLVALGLWKLRLQKSSATSGLPEEIYFSGSFSSSVSFLRLTKVWQIFEGYLATLEPPEIEL